MEAIILAGGLGSRLRNVISDLPKCLALIEDKPFLDFVIKHLLNNNVRKIIFSLGYKSELVLHYLEKNYSNLNYDYCLETIPLGTGGALKLALSKTNCDNVIVVNGDTFLNSNLSYLYNKHLENDSVCSFYIKEMNYFERYGTIKINRKNKVISIIEKKYCEKGFINTGQYILNVESYLKNTPNGIFSFETDFMEKQYKLNNFFAFKINDYFIDIGIPEDFNKAQKELVVFK